MGDGPWTCDGGKWTGGGLGNVWEYDEKGSGSLKEEESVLESGHVPEA